MHKIGIIGHSVEYLGSDIEKIKASINYTIDLLIFQYGRSELVFNICGRPGVSDWVAEECMKNKYKYHLYLPYPEDQTSQHWYNNQKASLAAHYKNAYAVTVCSPNTYCEDTSHERLVDGSNFVVCFWVGKKQGQTFEAIKHALYSNKIVVNALSNLKLITVADFK